MYIIILSSVVSSQYTIPMARLKATFKFYKNQLYSGNTSSLLFSFCKGSEVQMAYALRKHEGIYSCIGFDIQQTADIVSTFNDIAFLRNGKKH